MLLLGTETPAITQFADTRSSSYSYFQVFREIPDPAVLLAVSLENTHHSKSLQDASRVVLSFQVPIGRQHKAAASKIPGQDSQVLGEALVITNSGISGL